MKKRTLFSLFFVVGLLLLAACGSKSSASDKAVKSWLKATDLTAEETPEELYQKALKEDTLIIYTITTRITEVKRSFEAQYPGLYVEVQDVKSSEMIDMVEDNFNSGRFNCDLVICNDNNAQMSEALIDTGMIYPYIPYDIAPKLKEGQGNDQLNYLEEAQMIFYNSAIYDSAPIQNIWEMCEAKYKGKIYMPSPLRSSSTFGFCSMILSRSDELAQAYEEYTGIPFEDSKGYNAAEVFLQQLSQNVHFSNSSDEVVEAIGSEMGTGLLGIMISSKYRLKEVGYHMEPINRLNPFCGTYASTSIMVAGGAKNISSAKLFIRWLLGEADGTGVGYIPFQTEGTWSSRIDVSDGNDIPQSEIDLLRLDKNYMKEKKHYLIDFFNGILKNYSDLEAEN